MAMSDIIDRLPRVKGSTGVQGNWMYSVHSSLSEILPDLPAPHKYPAEDRQEFYSAPPNRAFCFPFISDVAFLLASDIPNRTERAKKRIDAALRTIGREQMLLALDAGEAGLMEKREDILDEKLNVLLVAFGMGYFTAIWFIRAEILGEDVGNSLPDLLRAQIGRSPLLEDVGDFFAPLGIAWIFAAMLEFVPPPAHFSKKGKVMEILSRLTGTAYIKANIPPTRLNTVLPKINRSLHDIHAEIMERQRYSLWPGITDVEWREKGLEGLSFCPRLGGEIHVLIHARDEQGPMHYFFPLPPLHSGETYEGVDNPAATIAMETIRMCVVPAEEKVRENRVPRGYVKHSPGAAKGGIPVIYVPRVRYVGRAETESSGGGGGSPKRPHQVAGFLRQLPIGWHASPEARRSASAVGLELPAEGATFVRPHVRGAAEDTGTPSRRVKINRGRTES
ncbi:MAG: hypothetical protein IJR68_01520 [Fretibacterium sp.]|nr:hypothetical protein [Fretibacterium sp.]